MKPITILILITFLLCACAPTQVAQPSEERAFLLGQYLEFTDLYNTLAQSGGTGTDVEKAYFECQNIIVEVSDAEISDQYQDLASDLLRGLTKYCTGFGCYSNKALCKNDAEATGLIYEGKVLLDSFYNEISSP